MSVRLLHPAAVTVVVLHLAFLGFGWWALHHIIPDTLPLHILGNQHVVWGVHRRLIDRAVEVGLLIPAIFFVEYLWMGWRQSSVHHLLLERTASTWSDIACYLFELAPASALISAVMSFGAVYISGGLLRHLFGQATGIHFNIAGAPLMVQTGALLLLYTLLDYWSHRLDHSRIFWPLHRFHHSAESFSVLTAARIHPAMFTAAITTVLPGVLLGCTRGALADVGLFIAILRLVIHSRIDSGFGWVGRWIVQSPLHHRLHHSFNRMPFNSALLPIWDRLFGTWRDVPKQQMRIGTVTPYRHGIWVGPDIWRDYCEFWAGLKKAALRLTPTVLKLRALGDT